MKRLLLLVLLAVFVTNPGDSVAWPVEITPTVPARQTVRSDLDLSIRLVGGTGAVLQPGRDVNLTFQTSSDAYVIIYSIDSDGYVNLLYPADGNPRLSPAGKVIFLPEKGTGVAWRIAGSTGIEYIHALAIEDPGRIDRDELYYLSQTHNLPEEQRLRIEMDPFLAFNMITEELIGDAQRMPPATDYTYFYVNQRVEYPAYLCDSRPGVDDPYRAPCAEVLIAKIAEHEDSVYPYPRLFAMTHIDVRDEPAAETFTYYTDNLSVGYDDYRYDETKVYLSIYHYGGWYPYHYRSWWPGYWAWYVNWSPSWYWDTWSGYGWGIGWNWGGYYYHHWPFYSWYPHYYHAYWHGYRHGQWCGYYYNWYDWNYRYAHPAPGRSIYAGRSIERRAVNYATTAVATNRRQALETSRLTRERSRTMLAQAVERSTLARGTADRARVRTAYRTIDTQRLETSRLREAAAGRTSSTYGATRSARDERLRSTITPARSAADRERAPTADRSGRHILREGRVIDRGAEQRARDTGRVAPRPIRGDDSRQPQRDERTTRQRDPQTGRTPSAPPPARTPARAPERPQAPPARERGREQSTSRGGDSGSQPARGPSARPQPPSPPPASPPPSTTGSSAGRSSGGSSGGSGTRRR